DAADSEPRPAGAAPAGGTAAEQADVTGASAAPWSADGRTAADAAPATTSGAHLTAAAAPGADGAATGSGLESLLYDGVTDGELIAKIPTDRLVRSLLRDLGFVFGTLASVLGVGFAIVVGIWQEGINIAMIIALFPAFIAVPKFVFGRIESGWGFVSRITDRGLRMRRGLANTRTDNPASGRVQRLAVGRPLLWRAPDWTAVSVTVAGIDDDSEHGAQNVLPVGTRDELGATLGHLAAPLGTADDLATLEHLLSAPAPGIEGLRKPLRLYWIARRTQVAVLLPGALVHRTGILGRSLEIIPRERIQHVSVSDGPLSRRLGLLDLKVGVAGHTVHLTSLARSDALALHAVLARDGRTLRRYRDRAQWPAPVLAAPRRPPPRSRRSPPPPRVRRRTGERTAPRHRHHRGGPCGRRARRRAARRGPRPHRRLRRLRRLPRPRRRAAAGSAAAGRPRARRAQRDAAAGRPRRPAGTAGRRHRRDRDGPRRAARRPHLGPLRHRRAGPARRGRQRHARPPPRDDLHRHPHRPRPAHRLPDGHHRRPRAAPRRRRAGGRAGRGLRRDRRRGPAAVPRRPRPLREPPHGARGPGARGPVPAGDRGSRRVPAPAARGGARGVPAPRGEGADRTGGARGRRHRLRPPRGARGSRRHRGAGRARRRRRHLPR